MIHANSKVGDEVAGFVLINQLEVMPEVDWNMGEFFIVGKYQRSGLGRAVATQVFAQFPGQWSVGAIPENSRALGFWRQIIGHHTQGQFTQTLKSSADLKTAEHPDPLPLIMFTFQSPIVAVKRDVNQAKIILREPTLADEKAFLAMASDSQSFHHPWVKAPQTSAEYQEYVERYQQSTHKSYLLCTEDKQIAGVFNISEIVRGNFQNAYLGFYVAKAFAGQGLMSRGMKILLERAENELGLHRIEANIQPQNEASIRLVQNSGFKKEGYSPSYLKVDGRWCDHERWAITFKPR
jgi:RimJ/RimL family protein N-acetyltransferase